MIKIKGDKIVILLLLILGVIIISSCSKTECKTNTDCISKVCTISKCESNKCALTPQKNCCGNGIMEAIENGKPGNKCTCPQDYGRCEGKAKINYLSRIEDAKYLQYICNSGNNCVLGVEKPNIFPQNFLDPINIGYFKASLVLKYNKPFDVSNDIFEFAITLDDVSKGLVLPVKLTKIKIFLTSQSSRSELLVAEKDIDNSLQDIGSKSIINVPLNLDYRPQEVEEQGSIRYSLSYTYVKSDNSARLSNGTYTFSSEPVRESFSGIGKPIFLIRTG